MQTIFFVTQELCDEASLFIALKHDIDVKITRNISGISIESNGSFPTQLVVDLFLHYLRCYFLEDHELQILRFASLCRMEGKIINILQAFTNHRNN